MSHLGVLFLDELTEFPRHHIDALRQPLESGSVTISRAHQTLTYPASFLLVGACNPCPCGYRGDHIRYCACTPGQADRYWSRLSGPFMDRIDLHIEVSRLEETELMNVGSTMTSEQIRLQVMRAVEAQRNRSPSPDGFRYNGSLNQRELARFCRIKDECRAVLARAVSSLGMSARAYDRVLRLARTIADLEGSSDIERVHIAEAVRYRTLQAPTAPMVPRYAGHAVVPF